MCGLLFLVKGIKQNLPIKIAFFTIMAGNFSGAGKNIFRLLNRLNPKILKPVLVGNTENELSQHVKQINLEVFVVPYPSALDVYDKKLLSLRFVDIFGVFSGLWKYNISIINFYKRIKPQVVWADNLRTFFFLYVASKLCGCKVILNIMSEPQGKVAWFLHRLGLILADVINLEYNKQGRKMFGSMSALQFFQKKLVTLYSGVTDFEQSFGNDIRNELDLLANDILVLMAANIVPGKGQIDLIKSIEMLIDDYPRLILLLAGQPTKFHPNSLSYDYSLKQYVNENNLNNNVYFLGWRSDMPDLLNSIDIYASTSYSESLPDVLRDAMAAGKPIVASNVGGTFELINGKNGFMFEPGDIDSLAKYIKQLIQDSKLRKSMGQEGKLIINQRFSTKVYARNFEEMVLYLYK